MDREFWKIKSNRDRGEYIVYGEEGREIPIPDLSSAITLVHSLNRRYKDALEEPHYEQKLMEHGRDD